MNKMRTSACMVLYVTFTDGNKRTFWSRDSSKPDKAGNHAYWFNHLQRLAESWSGKVKEYAIFRVLGGERVGDAILKANPGI